MSAFLFRAPPFRRLALVLVLVLAVHGLLVLVALKTYRKEVQAESAISGFFLTQVGVVSQSNSIRASDSPVRKSKPNAPRSTSAPTVPTPARNDIQPATPTTEAAGLEDVKASQSAVGSYQREQNSASETSNVVKGAPAQVGAPQPVIIESRVRYKGEDELRSAFRASRAFRRGVSGTVVLVISVDEHGKHSATVKTSSGDSELDKIAIDHATRIYRLHQKTVDGVPVPDQKDVSFVMKIEESN
jgi:TonB family protein